MKSSTRWLAIAVTLAVLGLGLWRVQAARSAQQARLQAQQAAMRTQAMVELGANDLVRIKPYTIQKNLAVSGPLKAVSSAVVKARVAGELQYLVLREGDKVQAGAVVARIDPVEYQARVQQARQQAEAAKAQVDIAQRSFDNNRALVNQGFISKTALDTSQANLAAAQASYRAAQATVDVAAKALTDTVLRAPITGQVAQRLAQPGERVAVDTRILEIVDPNQLELEASVAAADSLAVRIGQRAQVTVEGASETLTATVVRINPSAVTGSRAVLVYLALPPQPGLRQGLFAQGTLATGNVQGLAVPLTAVRTDKPEPYVQLVRAGQVAHQAVSIQARGQVDGQTLAVISGAPEGADILAGSVGSLRAGTHIKLAPNTPGAP